MTTQSDKFRNELGVLVLDAVDLHKLNYEHERVKRIQAEILRLKAEVELNDLRSQLRSQSLRSSIAGNERLMKQCQEDLLVNLGESLTEKYGLDFRKVTFDPDSGTVSEDPALAPKE